MPGLSSAQSRTGLSEKQRRQAIHFEADSSLSTEAEGWLCLSHHHWEDQEGTAEDESVLATLVDTFLAADTLLIVCAGLLP